MATPPLSPSLLAVKTSRTDSWIRRRTPSPFADGPFEPVRPSKRKRASSAPMSELRQGSPEKRQRVEDGVMPGESASLSGHPLDLGQYNTFSPSRETIATLKDAFPPIQTEPFNGAQLPTDKAVRNKVMAAMERLGPGQVEGWVPRCLQEVIRFDTTLGVQTFDRHAFMDAPLSEYDPALHDKLQYVLGKIKQIYERARTCKIRGRDENAWCQVVIQPLVELALELSGNSKLLLQSVQTQAIEPGYLSTDSKTGRRLDRKADLTLSYSHEDSDLATLYASLPPQNSAVSHVSDTFTKTTALFSGIEAKPADGDKLEAEYQISIWMGASLRKKAELARMAGLPDITSALIEPAFVVVGHEWYFYLVYLQPNGTVHVLEHGSCSTNSVSGVFKILRVLRNVVEYALEGFEGSLEATVGYWGDFWRPVLVKLGEEERTKGDATCSRDK